MAGNAEQSKPNLTLVLRPQPSNYEIDIYNSADDDTKLALLNSQIIQYDDEGNITGRSIEVFTHLYKTDSEDGFRSSAIIGLTPENLIGMANGLMKSNIEDRMPDLSNAAEQIKRAAGMQTAEDIRMKAFEDILHEVADRLADPSEDSNDLIAFLGHLSPDVFHYIESQLPVVLGQLSEIGPAIPNSRLRRKVRPPDTNSVDGSDADDSGSDRIRDVNKPQV